VHCPVCYSAPDIQRQLPVEAKAFAGTDKQLRDAARRTKDRPNALAAGTQPGGLELFKRANLTLEKIQKVRTRTQLPQLRDR
jgi:dynein heavy chain, axonemal